MGVIVGCDMPESWRFWVSTCSKARRMDENKEEEEEEAKCLRRMKDPSYIGDPVGK